MDLERLGAAALAGRLWPGAAFSATPGPGHRRPLHRRRAAIRARSRRSRHEQGESHAANLAPALLGLTVDHLDAAAFIVLVGGLPGTGKSSLAAALADRLPVVVLRTDEVRAGHAEPGGAYGEGRYAPTAIAQNYRVLLDQAAPLLRSGESVVLDGSWSRDDLRSLAAEHARERSATSSNFIAWHRPRSRTLGPRNVLDPRRSFRGNPDGRRGDGGEFRPVAAASILDTSRSLDEAVTDALPALGATAPPLSGTAHASGSDD